MLKGIFSRLVAYLGLMTGITTLISVGTLAYPALDVFAGISIIPLFIWSAAAGYQLYKMP